MNNRFDRNILLSLTGMIPQVVTETMWALTNRGERIDEIRIITTASGRQHLERELLDPQRGQFFAFCRDYGIDPGRINFGADTISMLHFPDGRLLDDIRTPEENMLAANQICAIVRELTRDTKTQLFASAAGGRKTMSIYLATAMQLYARSWDTLWHVLVSPEFEQLDDFYYIPPTPRQVCFTDRQSGQKRSISTAKAEIDLAPIAFVRLRGILGSSLIGDGKSYDAIVSDLQSNLDLLEESHDLRISTVEKCIEVSGLRVRLTEREIFLYLLFAWYRKTDGTTGNGFRRVFDIKTSDLEWVFRMVTRERGEEIGLEESESYPRFNFLKILADQLSSAKKEDRDDVVKVFREIRSKINQKIKKSGIPIQYQLASNGERGSISYGINITPDQIDLKIDPDFVKTSGEYSP
jgi:CRISPR-associated protein (TIGR02584 family)